MTESPEYVPPKVWTWNQGGGGRFANIWLHNAMLLVDGEKMSKSLGNFLTIRDVVAGAPAEALRLVLLGTHYRSVLNYTARGLTDAGRTLDRFYRAIRASGISPATVDAAIPDAFLDALCQDLNTPGAIAVLHRLADAALAGDTEAGAGLRAAGQLLGLLEADPELWFQAGVDGAAVQQAITERLAARKARDFARADAIRADLLERGVMLEDGPSGTTWRRLS